MQRDLELIRKLFFRIEEFPYKINNDFDYEIKVDGYSIEEINFHLYLMKQAQFLDGIIHKSDLNKYLTVLYDTLEITWKGYDFFNSIRDNKIWDKIKRKLFDINIPIGILKELGIALIKENLKI